MTYSHQNWPPSPPPWPSDPNTEHRLTVLEVTTHHHAGHHEEHFEATEKHRDRLNLHERLLLILAGVLSIVIQDKFPKLAALIKGVMP